MKVERLQWEPQTGTPQEYSKNIMGVQLPGSICSCHIPIIFLGLPVRCPPFLNPKLTLNPITLAPLIQGSIGSFCPNHSQYTGTWRPMGLTNYIYPPKWAYRGYPNYT